MDQIDRLPSSIKSLVLLEEYTEHEAACGGLGRSAEGCRGLSPSTGLNAEDTEIDGVAAGGHDAILGNYAILLAAGDNLACQEK